MSFQPPLAWLKRFSDSVSLAIGDPVTCIVEETVNPLVFKLKFNLAHISSKNRLYIWNLLEIFASLNDCVTNKKTAEISDIWALDIITKRRLGPKRNKHPLE
jgi:hypothetical protein